MANDGPRPSPLWIPQSRRRFLKLAGTVALGAAAAGCASEPEGPAGQGAATGPAPTSVFNEPASRLSGDLKLLLWSHFVPSHDQWFDQFAKDWGKQVGVNVSVDHIDNAQVPDPDRCGDPGPPGPRRHPLHRHAVAVRAERHGPDRHHPGGQQPVG
jgi:hypothetical protein